MHFGGSKCLTALSKLLKGESDFTGRLTETYLKNESSVLCRKSESSFFNVDYSEKENVGYRYFSYHPQDILFPFGMGLSYKEIHLKTAFISDNHVFNLDSDTLDLTLTYDNNCKSIKVVQIYLSDLDRSNIRLIYFDTHSLEDSNSTIQIKIPYDYLTTYNLDTHCYGIENKKYLISIGESSIDLTKSLTINIEDKVIHKVSPSYPIIEKVIEQDVVTKDTPIATLEGKLYGDPVYKSIYTLIHSIDDSIKELFYEYAINLPIRAIGTHLKNDNVTSYLVAKANNDLKTMSLYSSEVIDILK